MEYGIASLYLDCLIVTNPEYLDCLIVNESRVFSPILFPIPYPKSNKLIQPESHAQHTDLTT